MKIAYVTSYDARDIKSWSGIPYYMSNSLRSLGSQLEYVGPLKVKTSSELMFKAKRLLKKLLLGKRYMRDADTAILEGFAKQAAVQLKTLNSNIVFSPVSYTLGYLECKQRMILWADATFAGLIDYYPFHSNLCKESVQNGIAMEQSAFEKCSLAIFSSDWAARTATENYQVDKAKIKVVPYGANIECDRSLDDIKSIGSSKPLNKCNLLFLGVNWFRKGGDIALEITKELNKAGLNTQLTVVGCQPIVNNPLPNFVNSLGFISKATEEGRRQIDQLLTEAHFLILPSRADCTPVVFGEANSFGLPCLSTDIGGIPTLIRDEQNGKLFSKDASIAEYCQYIFNLFSNYSRYQELAQSSFHEYQSRLNWSVAAQSVKQLLLEVA